MTTSADLAQGPRRLPLIAALVLAIVFVLVALVGARIAFDHSRLAPVSLSAIPGGNADAPECATFVESAPEKVAEFQRVDILDPIPPGTVAWAVNQNSRLVARCGVDMPLQYTTLTTPIVSGDTQWMAIADPTKGVDLTSFYTLNTSPVIAVTATTKEVDREKIVADLAEVTAKFVTTTHTPNEAPLASLPLAKDAATGRCETVITRFNTLVTDERYQPATQQQLTEAGYRPEIDRVWVADGLEPIVIRCGVDNSPAYQPGVSLVSINTVPFFEDTILASGTTLGFFYPQGTDYQLVLALPQDQATTLLQKTADLIAGDVKEAN